MRIRAHFVEPVFPRSFLKELEEAEDMRYTFIGYKNRLHFSTVEHDDMTYETITHKKLAAISISFLFLLVKIYINHG